MAALDFNSYLDRWKHRILSMAGSKDFSEHLQRAGLSYKDFKLTSTQLDTLNATPVALIAAPGAGLVTLVSQVFTFIDVGATPFEAGSATLGFTYTDGSGAASATAIPNATLESATDTYYWSVGLACVPVVNAAIVASVGTDISAGDGTLYGRIWYRTVKVAEVGVTQQL